MTDVMLHPAQPPSIDRGRHRAGVRRVEVKHLRYALELFEPALGEQAQPLLVALVAAQDHLGELHDAEIALARASDDEGPDRLRVRDTLYAATPQALAPLMDPSWPERLAGLVAKL